jgi:hypothetical protein
MRGHLDWDSAGGAEVATLNRDLAAAIREWMAPLVERNEIRSASMVVLSAIVTGPAHALAQRWLAGQIRGPLTAFVDELADAAWAGLRGKPARRRAAMRAAPDRGRLTLELVSGDGVVVARGEGTAELHAVEP